jgi:hypothetical protein
LINQITSYLVTTDPVLIATRIGLYISIFFLAVLLVNSVYSEKSKVIRDNFSKALNQDREINYRKYLNKDSSLHFEISTLDLWSLRFIERSYVKRFLPFMNIYILLVSMAIIFVLTYVFVIQVIPNILAVLIISGIMASIPIMILELLGKYMSDKARQDLYTYVATMHGFARTRSDINFIFSKTADSMSGPLSAHTKVMVAQIKGNLDPEIAMDLLKMKISNKHFDVFMLNMIEAYKNQGDLERLLSKLESEFFRLEEAYNSRKMKTLFDRNILLGFMLMTLVITMGMVTTNEKARYLFFETVPGQFVFSISSICFAIGMFWQFKITDFKH